jgi:hypothetical protein
MGALMRVRQTHHKIVELLGHSELTYEEFVSLQVAFDLLHDSIVQNGGVVPAKLVEDYGTLWAEWVVSNES